MAFLILPNTFGVKATTINASVQAGSDKTRMVAGPRSQLTTGANGTSWAMSYEAASTAVTHCVVTSANLFAQGQYADEVDVTYSSSATVDSTTVAGSMVLVGPNSQDWVKPIAQTSDEFGLEFRHTQAADSVVGKVFFSTAFDFGTNPEFSQLVTESEKVRPLWGHRQYAVERKFSLAWSNLTQAKLAAFRALPIQIPFFAYDDSGDIFDHKLEHVVIAEPWTESRRVGGEYTLTLVLHRLTQYVD